MSLDIGTLLHRRYRIVENLAQGGMGSVYSATDETLGIVVAVKENLFTTEEAARQFRLEATILANMRHPNLPRVTDHFNVEGQGQYLVMDFIEGEDLRERMERVGAIPEDDVIMIGAAICDALTYLHSRMPPILHRDIKPGNVKIAPNGHIVLLDFGLAKVVQGDQATTVGAWAMTPGYSPPEQYGTARTDPRSDIYSLGATLYAAASGVIPEDGLARAMENAELEPLRKRNPGTSRRFALVIEKAMAVDPLDRFQTAEDFKRALLASKSKTQQPVGSYMIAPPPSSGSDGHELVLAQAVKGNGNLVTNSQKDVPFLTPRKRQSLRASRIRRLMIVGLLAVLFFGFVGVTLLAPDLLPQSFQRFLGASLSTRVVSTPVFTITPLGAEMTPSDAEVVILPTQTEAVPQPTPGKGGVPTPPGSEDLQVAFASARSGLPQIYVTTLHGDITQLTDMKEGACQPAWSPDGSQVAFISPCKLRQDTYKGSSLYLIQADGTGLQPLNSVPGGDFEPAWSPDGRYIAFTSVRTGHMQIYSYDLRSGITQRLIRTPLGRDARQPAWSPNGQTIAFAERRSGNIFEIWTMTNLGRDQEPLVRGGDQVSDSRPTWSPDGKLILFHRSPADKFGFPKLLMLPMEGNKADGEVVSLSMNVLSINNVDYSPDGFWLVFEYSGDTGSDVYYMTVTGAEKTALASDPADDFDPAWRPRVKP